MTADSYDRLAAIIVKQLDIDPNKVKPEASFVDDLGADSLDLVEMTMSTEEAFGIEIPDEDAEKLRTVQDAVAYLNALPAARAGDAGTSEPTLRELLDQKAELDRQMAELEALQAEFATPEAPVKAKPPKATRARAKTKR